MRGKERNFKMEAVNSSPAINVSIHNKFEIEVIDANTGEKKASAKAYNCVCNQLWYQLLNTFKGSVHAGGYNTKYTNYNGADNYFNYLHFGEGTGEPAPEDTQLFQFSGYISPEGYGTWKSTFNPIYGGSYTRKFILGQDKAVGIIISEVGIGKTTDQTSLMTHAMLQDMNGNPITIEKTDTDIINFYATVYSEIQTSIPKDSIGTGITIVDSDAYLARQMCGAPDGYIRSNNMWFRIDDVNEASVISSGLLPAKNSKGGSCTVDIDNKEVNFTCSRFGVNDFNTGRGSIGVSWNFVSLGYVYSAGPTMSAIGSASMPTIIFDCRGSWWEPYQILGESIGTGDGQNSDFKTKFPLADNMKLYVNGVETNDYTFYRMIPEQSENVGRYFLRYKMDPNDMAGNYLTAYADGYANANGDSRPYNNNGMATGNQDQYYNKGKRSYWYNPYYIYGIKTVKTLGAAETYSLWTKANEEDDWIQLVNKGKETTYTIPDEHKYNKYWSISATYAGVIFNADTIPSYNIHFNTPPNEGDVITADYTTKMIPKDEDHVFDFSFKLKFGEPSKSN